MARGQQTCGLRSPELGRINQACSFKMSPMLTSPLVNRSRSRSSWKFEDGANEFAGVTPTVVAATVLHALMLRPVTLEIGSGEQG